jgi:hypothetical protein
LLLVLRVMAPLEA